MANITIFSGFYQNRLSNLKKRGLHIFRISIRSFRVVKQFYVSVRVRIRQTVMSLICFIKITLSFKNNMNKTKQGNAFFFQKVVFYCFFLSQPLP